MKMRKCTNGHYYDMSIYDTCPYCDTGTVPGTTPADSGGAAPEELPGMSAALRRCEKGHFYDERLYRECPYCSPADPQLVAPPLPVVGWLVCCKGNDKGRDYRIENGNNTIGRGADVLINIEHDETISHENMAIVTYDDRDKAFYLIAGTGKNMVYLNGKPLPASRIGELHAYDRIELGQTTLVFMPFCSESFAWTEE